MRIHSSKSSRKLTGFGAASLMAAVFCASLGTGIFTFTLPLMNLDEKAGGMWLGSGFAGYFLAKLLIAPLSGSYADRKGPLPALVYSCVLGVLLPIPYLLFPEIETLYVIQFVLGLCAGTIRTASMAAIGAGTREGSLPPQFARLSAVMNSSFLVGPLLGGLLYINKDYMPVLSATAAFMGAALILFLFAVDRTPVPRPHEPTARTAKSTLASSLRILLALFGRGVGIGTLIAFYPVLLKSALQLSPGLTAALFCIPSLATVLLLPLFGRLLKNAEHMLITCLGMLISSAALYMAAGCSSLTGFVAAGALSGVGAAVSMPASMTLCANLGNRKGRNLGLANLAANTGFMLGPLLCGTLVTLSGNLATPFRISAIVGAAATLPLMYAGLRKIGLKYAAYAMPSIAAVCLLTVIPAHLTNDSDNSPEMFRYSDVAMGTVVNLTIPGKKESATEKAALEETARQTISLMHNLQKDLDHRNKLGSVGRINHAAGHKSVQVSDKAFETIQHGLDISRKSSGSFDITIGAITTTPFYYALDKSRFEGHRKLINYRLLELDTEKKKVRLPRKGMALDLGGLAKGTVIDAAANYLRQSGVKTAMVEAGGDFMVFGDRVWSIGIRNPRGEGIIGRIEVSNSSVCGSGDYYQFINPVSGGDGHRKHHIFDPALLQSSAECVATTTVAPDAETADALATTVFIMGPEKGKKFMAEFFPECSAMWILPDLSIRTTDNFPHIYKEKRDKAVTPERD
ncbi:MFS transporter [Maridesulfovibrio sp.]|uniref:MFS transporter n=1 Tax=Maridesulfovibrio sp. TaxID=2795000 RepID=UPI002A186E3E|nr:MFS transporter [Maridesulfovibrio sp.]